MRNKTRVVRRALVASLIVMVAISYIIGFKNGEQSVYEKAKNSVDLLTPYSQNNK